MAPVMRHPLFRMLLTLGLVTGLLSYPVPGVGRSGGAIHAAILSSSVNPAESTADEAAQGDSLAKVEPLVLQQLDSGPSDFFVWLGEKANLSPARELQTKAEKGAFVFNTLRATASESQSALRALLDSRGMEYRPFYIANKILVRSGDRDLLLDLVARPDVARVTANHIYQLPPPIRNPQRPESFQEIASNLIFVNADDVWALGITGQGIVLAGNDTGIEWDHPALINQYRGWDGTTADHNYNWWDATGTYPGAPGDGHGHGTHTTGTMVGDDGGDFQIGMAPGARTIHCKNLTDLATGSDGTISECFEWDLAPWDLNGLNPRPDLAPDAINNSWGGPGGNPDFSAEIAALQAAGILVEFSAGNAGPLCGTLGSPGDFDEVLTTGSVQHEGFSYPGVPSWFSSRGPSLLAPDSFLPEIMAPGESIFSSLPGAAYTWMSGTSMAGPHTTGLVALLWAANPALRGHVSLTQQIILSTATPLSGQIATECGGDYETGPNNDWGYGTMDALGAVQSAMGLEYGTLAGMVSDSLTGAPLEGALVGASLDPILNWHATTDSQGGYTRAVFSGTYTVTGSLFGYYPREDSGIQVQAGGTTIHDIHLDPAPFYQVSGQVMDGVAGWPLYARIDINGYPGGPVWTDPLSGQYDITLAAGREYVFQVSAWVDGYHPSTRTVGPLTTSQTEDFALTPDRVACTAPGYAYQFLFFENFESGAGNWTLSGLWNHETEADTCGSLLAPFPSPISAAYYGLDEGCNYDTGTANTGVLRLNTPLPLPALGAPVLSLWSFEETECGGDCLWDNRSAQVSTDNGASWITLGELGGEGAWYRKSFDLSPFLGDTIRLRFRFDTVDEHSNTFIGWMVDDIGVAVDCQPTPGGLVVGTVSDGNTGNALNGARVAHTSGGYADSLPTPLDPALQDGFYTLFAPPGPQVITATRTGGYGSQVESPTVVLSRTVWQDFALPAGWLEADPLALETTLQMGLSTTLTMTLSNIGNLQAAYQIHEIRGWFDPALYQPVEVPGFQAPIGRDGGGRSYAGTHGHRLPSRAPWVYRPSPQALMAEEPLSVLVVAAGGGEQIQTILASYPDMGRIDVYEGRFGTPRLDQLMAYDSVIVTSAFPFADAEALGDRLADYVDAGGTVVQTGATFYDLFGDGWGLRGRFLDDGYSPFIGTGDWFSWADLGDYDGFHPIMEGVVQARDFLRQMVDLAPGARLVASWTDDEFVATKGRVVGLNALTADGFLWTGDVGLIIHNSVVWLHTAGDVPWLFTEPISGTLSAANSQAINVIFDSSVPEANQPGQYSARLRVMEDTPYPAFDIPIQMTVEVPSLWGKLSGTISGLGRCDTAPGAPLGDASVEIATLATLSTGVDGTFSWWLAQGTYDIRVSAAGYLAQTFPAIVTAGMTTTVSFELRPDAPCVSGAPETFALLVPEGTTRTVPLSLSNAGAGDLTYSFLESPLFLPPAVTVATVERTSDLVSSHSSVGRDRSPLAPVAQSPNLSLPRAPESGWYAGQSIPDGRFHYAHAQCDEQLGSFYVIGGTDEGWILTDRTFRYDALSNTWTELAPIPERGESPAAVCYQGKIYVMGGSGSDRFYIYDIIRDSWSPGPAIPRPVWGAAAGAWGGKVFLVGGSDDLFDLEIGVMDDVTDQVDIYDIASGTWSGEGTPMPAGTVASGYVQVGPYLYIVGGWGFDDELPLSNLGLTQRYDMASDAWEMGPAFSSLRADFALAATDRALYAMGGDADGASALEPTALVERLDLRSWPAGTWTDLSDPLPRVLTGNSAGFCTDGLVPGMVWSLAGLTAVEGHGPGDPSAPDDGVIFMFVVDENYFRGAEDESCYSIYADVPWMSVDSVSGSVVGDGATIVSVTFDAGELTPGTYTAALAINTNDSGVPLLVFPVQMTVVEAVHNLYLPLIPKTD